MRQDCGNVDVLSLLIQSPRLFSLFFGMKGQHSTDSMFCSKQPLPRVFCALPPIVPTSCVKTLAMWMYCLYWFNHPDFLRCFLAWKVNIQLTLCSTPSSLFLASSVLFLQSCLHHASRLWQCGCIVFIDSITQTLFAVFWHEKSTFNWLYVLLISTPSSLFLTSSVLFLQSCLHHASRLWQRGCIFWIDSTTCFLAWKVNIQLTLCSTHFYSKQPLPRVFCALPPVLPTWCAKTVAMRMYCLHWFNQSDSLRCFLAWKVNIQLTLCSTLAASSSRLLCSSSSFAYMARQDWQYGCNVSIGSIQTLFTAFVIKNQHSTDSLTLCSTLSRLSLCECLPSAPGFQG